MTHRPHRVTLHRPTALRAALLSCSILAAAPALAAAQDVRILRAPSAGSRTFTTVFDSDRPMIGVTTVAESERGDTLGLRIESVTRGSPAEKAGLKEGDRIQSVNGVSLRADRADAGEADYSGVLNRRLQRAVQATKPGDEVVLRVLSGGTARDVRVTPVEGSAFGDGGTMDLRRRTDDDDRAVLGVSVASTGSARDTIGLFVQSVVAGGPAEKAGIFEGDRIAAINGVSLRVPREDAEDASVGAMRAERLSREVAKLKAGDAAELTVVSGGRSRTVRVTTAKASELPEQSRGMFMIPQMENLLREMPNARVRVRTPDSPDDDGVIIERIAPRIQLRTPEGMRSLERSRMPAAPLVLKRSSRVIV